MESLLVFKTVGSYSIAALSSGIFPKPSKMTVEPSASVLRIMRLKIVINRLRRLKRLTKNNEHTNLPWITVKKHLKDSHQEERSQVFEPFWTVV